MTTKKNQEKFVIADVEIIIGNSYEVIPKKDYDAPKGFQEHNTTKYLMKGISEHRSITFDQTMNLWNTGFDIDSPVNAKIDPLKRKAEVDNFNKLVRQPFEAKYRANLESTNNAFWDEYTYELYTNKIFDTTQEKDRLDLFQALQNGRLCLKGTKNPTLQKDANYHIRSREKEISLKEERAETKFQAFATFSTLLNLDPKKDDTLYSVLEWLNLSQVRTSDTGALRKLVLRMFEDEKTGYDFSERFLKTYDESQTDLGKEKMQIFGTLQILRSKNKLDLKRQQYFIEDVRIGNTLKEAAETALVKPEIKELILRTYQSVT